MKRPRTMRRLTAGVIFASVSLVAVTVGSSPAAGAKGTKLDLALCAPGQNTFTLDINNTYFPLPAGREWVYTGTEQGATVSLKIAATDTTEALYRGQEKKKVTARLVEETEWFDTNGDGVIDADEHLIEFSVNYFAQTQAGTVCYFGEIVDIYEADVVVSHAGSWRADDPGNAPGIFMPNPPKVGMTFAQEAAPGIAEDQVTILAMGTVTVPYGTFPNAIKVRDYNPLDGSKGVKWYAPGVGLVVDGPLTLRSVT